MRTATPGRSTPSAPPSIRGILPPYLLRRLAQSGDPVLTRSATHTLQVDRTLRHHREVRGAHRLPGHRDGTPAPPGPGLIPPALRERIPREDTGARTWGVPAHLADGDEPAGAEAARTPGPYRSIHDALHRAALPGVLRRAEGDPPHEDESVNEAYDGLGATWALFHEVYGRDSLDGRGLPLIASVHFEKDYDNAFWDGQQMVFGDGDGRVFRSFTDSVDVIAHELAHGFTQYSAGFVYLAQAGALNESISDVFGVLTAQRALGQDAMSADWLIGAALFTESVHGVALRSMKAPGTAYDDPVLGTDPQPATMDAYVDLPHDEAHDNGGVHINSGIPNHAFYLASVNLGGPAWERTGQVWYDVMTQAGLPKDADFAQFAAATIEAAGRRYGASSREQQAIRTAWEEVKVTPAHTTRGRSWSGVHDRAPSGVSDAAVALQEHD